MAEFNQDSRFGVDTNQYSKPSMIGALQHFLKGNQIAIYCKDTISELVAYAQEKTDLGNARYRGAGGSHDDRVMSLVIAAYVAATTPVFEYDTTVSEKPHENLTEYNSTWADIKRELKAEEATEDL